jgi:phosphoenolpyruvate---glycerone phosphotransferase subunit DhaL
MKPSNCGTRPCARLLCVGVYDVGVYDVADVVISNAQLLVWLERCANAMSEHKPELTDLDAATGDADHGNNMARGFNKVQEVLPAQTGKAPKDIFKAISMVLMSSVGGASGPLYGSFFMQGGMAIRNEDGMSLTDLQAFLEKGVAAVKKRGRAEAGEKTMIDALGPAAEAVKASISKGDEVSAVLAAMVEAARAGMEHTISLKATKGRASYQGEKSIGHQDPGATSSYYLLRALQEIVQETP